MSQDNKKSPSVISVVGVVALIFAAMFVLFGGVQRFDKFVVETDLKKFAEDINAEAQKRGLVARTSFGSIEMVGWGYDKSAVIRDVSLEFSGSGAENVTRWKISTDVMSLRPDYLSANRLIADFNESIRIIKNDKILYTLRFNDALHYAHFDGLNNGVKVIDDNIFLPDKIMFVAAEGGASEITYNPNYGIQLRRWPQNNKMELNIVFENVRIAQNDVPLFMVGSFTNYLIEQPDDQQQLKGQYILTMIDFSLKEDGIQSKPYSFNLDLGYQADKDSMVHFAFNKFALMNNEFKIKLSGNLAASPDDRLPYGKLVLDIANPTKFIESDLITEQSRGTVADVLNKVSGNLEQKDISIPMTRDKKQVFYIGNLTFEEVTASLLTGLLQTKPDSAIPSPPKGTTDEE